MLVTENADGAGAAPLRVDGVCSQKVHRDRAIAKRWNAHTACCQPPPPSGAIDTHGGSCGGSWTSSRFRKQPQDASHALPDAGPRYRLSPQTLNIWGSQTNACRCFSLGIFDRTDTYIIIEYCIHLVQSNFVMLVKCNPASWAQARAVAQLAALALIGDPFTRWTRSSRAFDATGILDATHRDRTGPSSAPSIL
jgi:hypothetical protein